MCKANNFNVSGYGDALRFSAYACSCGNGTENQGDYCCSQPG